jgi:hypothetical protein
VPAPLFPYVCVAFKVPRAPRHQHTFYPRACLPPLPPLPLQAYTPTPAVLSVDFVSTSASPAQAWTSLDNKTWAAPVAATTFHAPTIGYMSQAVLNFAGVQPGQAAYYKLAAGGDTSPVFEVTPEVARPEVFAVFGDFGLSNDVCMTDITESAKRGDFDAVLHVGDWACVVLRKGARPALQRASLNTPHPPTQTTGTTLRTPPASRATCSWTCTRGSRPPTPSTLRPATTVCFSLPSPTLLPSPPLLTPDPPRPSCAEACGACPAIPGLGENNGKNFTECVPFARG